MPRSAKPKTQAHAPITKAQVAELAGVNIVEIMDYKEYPDRIVVVTIMGQKFEVMKDAN